MVVKPLEIFFEKESNLHKTKILLENISEENMAFKVKSNNVGRYTVTPNIGICFPQERLLVDIVLNGDLKDIANDKFQVIAVPYKIIGLESQIT
jgi:hypothetical protein